MKFKKCFRGYDMTQFLFKHLPESRAEVGRLAGAVGIGCNLLLASGKLLAGLLSGSVAIVADAANNFSDSASSIVTLLGFRLAQRPADPDHPYGHARYEYLAGLLVSAIILVLGLELGITSVKKIITPEPVEITLLTGCILAASMGVKLWMGWFYTLLGRKIDSAVLLASAADSRNDVIATGAVALGCVLQRSFGWNADGFLGLGVAGFILYSGVSSMRETVSPLLGRQADSALVEKLSQLILSHERVLGIHDLLVHDYGPGQCFASVHAEVSASASTLEAHDLLDDIEDDALEQLGVHLVIHCDPIVTDDPQWEAIREAVEQAAGEISPSLSVHDFHIMHHDGTQLGFDLAIPFEFALSEEEIRQRMVQRLREQGIPFEPDIHFDKI